MQTSFSLRVADRYQERAYNIKYVTSYALTLNARAGVRNVANARDREIVYESRFV